MSNPFLKIIQPIPIKEPLGINEQALSKMEALAIRHNLFPLLYVQLQKYNRLCNEGGGIQDYLQKKKTLFLTIAARSMQQETIEKEIVSLFSSKDIPSIVIKGNRIAKDIYNDPNCRNSSDIDILIKQSDVHSADKILSEKGFKRPDKNPIGFWISRLHHAQYRHPNWKDFIEIHWHFGIPGFFNLNSAQIWHEIKQNNSGQLRLSPEMTFILLLMHHHMHAFRDLKILLDIVWAAHAYEREIRWTRLPEKLRSIGLVKTTKIALKQARSLWGNDFFKGSELWRFKAEMEKMHPKVPGFLNAYFKLQVEDRNLHQIKKDDIFFRFALDHWLTILFSFLKTAFPFPDAIKQLYDDQRNWRLPKNYLRFVKWRLEEWKGF
jgi:putative nucleotidyltransferase-like protein